MSLLKFDTVEEHRSSTLADKVATPTVIWEVTINLDNDARTEALRSIRINEFIRRHLVSEIAHNPELAEAECNMPPFFKIRMHRRTQTNIPGADLVLKVGPLPPLSSTSGGGTTGITMGSSTKSSAHFVKSIPDPSLTRKRLVGLDSIRDEVLLTLSCRYGNYLENWSLTHGTTLPTILCDNLEQKVPLFLFSGDPGVGKSVLAQVIANTYCTEADLDGYVVMVGTEVRGNGLVGDFSTRIREAFNALKALPSTGLRCLILDEADTLAMRRSEQQAHQEDRAATNTLLQCLDELESENNVLVILTTNRLDAIDPALRRRCIEEFIFPRPDMDARAALIQVWVPHIASELLVQAVQISEGLTPADIERAIGRAYRQALKTGSALNDETLLTALRRQGATQSV